MITWFVPSRRRTAASPLARTQHRSWAAASLFLVFAAPAYVTAGDPDAGTEGNGEALPELSYLLSTPQIEHPLKPLTHLTAQQRTFGVDAAVVSVADPVETHLGRVFDIQVASIIRAYHSRGYVLDRFAFTWKRPAPEGNRIPEGGTVDYKTRHRHWPSVLVFREDAWRTDSESPDSLGVFYSVLFLTGESPTFGIQSAAFAKAAICATVLNGIRAETDLPTNFFEQRCDAPTWVPRDSESGPRRLEIIGPSFSGSMQSLTDGLADYLDDVPAQSGGPIAVNVVSPSATVKSNQRIAKWLPRRASNRSGTKFSYSSLGQSLEEQLRSLCLEVLPEMHPRFFVDIDRWKRSASNESNATAGQKAPDKDAAKAATGEDESDEDDSPSIVFLVEESTFGAGIQPLIKAWKEDEADAADPNGTSEQLRKCVERVRVTQFPQNIAAIRAEHSRADQEQGARLRKSLMSRSKLLELDISDVDERSDRPPAYHRKLSSRSDELMLYGTFDALRVWVKPDVVAIVATDVRDRLFLLNEVRKNLPTSLPVLMEMDFLTAHPDYRKISRGSVVIPNGETLIKVLQSNRSITSGYRGVDYYAFPSDYAANMFRGIHGLLDRQRKTPADPDGDQDAAAEAGGGHDPQSKTNEDKGRDYQNASGKPNDDCWQSVLPQPYVTTLAGFQRFSCTPHQSRLLVADSRLSLELAVYLLIGVIGLVFAFVGAWIRIFGYEHLVMTSALRNINPLRGIKENPEDYAAVAAGPAGASGARPAGAADSRENLTVPVWATHTAAIVLIGFGIAIAALGLLQVWDKILVENRQRLWALPHGRDAITLWALFFIYAVVGAVGAWRLILWRRRYTYFMGGTNADREEPALGPGIGHDGRGGAGLFAAAAIFGLFVISIVARGTPASIDSAWPSLLTGMILLPVGAWFIFEFWTQAKRWSRFAMFCGRTMDFVSKSAKRPGGAADGGTWPSPLLLGELPQSPFSLQFRKRDLDAFRKPPSDLAWARDTRQLAERNWPFGDQGASFGQWQDRLVAEMRYAAVAVRTAAWCGILAPAIVLLGISSYPPANERLQTSVAVALIVLGFSLVMYVVLRLERHPLLGRMFTQHGDQLTFSGAVGALWPKVLAALIVLVPVLFPDFLDWIYGMLRSIDSLK